MTRDMRKSGIPVLAYPECDVSPVSSSLIFRFNESRATASLLLQSSIFVDGHDEKQTFVLQFDADNLKHGRNALGPATIPLPQSRLDEVSREGNPQIRTLSLTMNKMCPVWCPPSPGPVTPKADHEAAFSRLANLAKATKLYILFDYNWLHRDHHNIFQRLVDHPEQLTGFPVWRHYSKQYRREDWSVFDAPDDAATEDEAPPVYAESCKRPRQVTPTPSSPPPKRIFLSPYTDTHTSATEKDSIATSSPRVSQLNSLTPGLPKSTAASPKSSHSYTDLDAPSQKPDTLVAPRLEQPLAHSSPDTQHAIEQALSTLLPSMLDTLLPSLLPRLLTASSPSPAPSLASMASQTSTAPPPPTLSALGVSIAEHMTRRVEQELSSLYYHTVSHANHVRHAADAQFFEEREEERLAFERVAELKFGEFKDLVEECGEAEVGRVQCRVEELSHRVIDDVSELEQQKTELAREREDLRNDKAELRLEKKNLSSEKHNLKVEKAEFKLLQRALQREREVLIRATPTQNTHKYTMQATRAASAPP